MNRLSLFKACVTTLLVCLFSVSIVSAAEVSGRVLSPDGSAVSDATVTLVELNRRTDVDDQGRFSFSDVPSGDYHVLARSSLFGGKVAEVSVNGGDAELELTLDRSQHRERIVVTSTRSGRGTGEVVSPVNVMDRSEISQQGGLTLGETLSSQPGLRSTGFGPGAGRPIIRGQDAGRIRVLEGGVDVGDASTTSPDHAVSSDIATAQQIEVVRGPATLLYGSSAVGGVVNILDNRVPSYVPSDSLSGSVELRYGSAAEEQTGAVVLDGGIQTGGRTSFAWHVDAVSRETEDVDIPGQGVQGDPESPFGTLPNSSVESETITAGVSAVGDWGFFGVSVREFDTDYGIPAELEEEEEEESIFSRNVGVDSGGDGIRIDMEQKRFDVRSSFNLAEGALFDTFDFRAGVTDYEHAELEGAEVGTEFFTEAVDARFELKHGAGKRLSGVIGLQVSERDLEAIGAEAFLPESQTESVALFALERLEQEKVHYEFGLRLENQESTTEATTAAEADCLNPTSRNFDNLSGSFGAVWLPGPDFSLGATVTHAVRAPGAEELFSCGPHVATLSFEVGDPNLRNETARGLDVSLRKRTGRLTGELNVFMTQYDNYIYELATGGIEDGLPVFQFTQADAEFRGFELSGLFELLHGDGHDLDLEFVGDTVRGELRDGGMNLPRIPATSLGVGIRYRGQNLYANAHVRQFDDQDRISMNETRTEGYTLINAAVGYRFSHAGFVHDFSIQGFNLGDEEARLHTSRLKDFVQLPGTDLRAIYRLLF
ncbi:hypothetical protein ABI59_06505 [Acidobacteria bacterium Mor1]|nr:hypothetical protein ABI59_06505 [Acidobacteria bacterium Mor1]